MDIKKNPLCDVQNTTIHKKRRPYITMLGKWIIATAFTDKNTVTTKCYE